MQDFLFFENISERGILQKSDNVLGNHIGFTCSGFEGSTSEMQRSFFSGSFGAGILVGNLYQDLFDVAEIIGSLSSMAKDVS